MCAVLPSPVSSVTSLEYSFKLLIKTDLDQNSCSLNEEVDSSRRRIEFFNEEKDILEKVRRDIASSFAAAELFDLSLPPSQALRNQHVILVLVPGENGSG